MRDMPSEYAWRTLTSFPGDNPRVEYVKNTSIPGEVGVWAGLHLRFQSQSSILKIFRKYSNAKCHLSVISRRGLVIRNVTSHFPFLHIPTQNACKSKNQGTPLAQILDFNDFHVFETRNQEISKWMPINAYESGRWSQIRVFTSLKLQNAKYSLVRSPWSQQAP